MKYLVLILLAALLLWLLYVAWTSRRKSPYDRSGDGGGSAGDSGDWSSTHCNSDGGCGGGDGGGGD